MTRYKPSVTTFQGASSKTSQSSSAYKKHQAISQRPLNSRNTWGKTTKCNLRFLMNSLYEVVIQQAKKTCLDLKASTPLDPIFLLNDSPSNRSHSSCQHIECSQMLLYKKIVPQTIESAWIFMYHTGDIWRSDGRWLLTSTKRDIEIWPGFSSLDFTQGFA